MFKTRKADAECGGSNQVTLTQDHKQEQWRPEWGDRSQQAQSWGEGRGLILRRKEGINFDNTVTRYDLCACAHACVHVCM